MKHIVIIGGGFGGVNLAKGLGNKDGFRVTLVDRNNYNFFPPLLYQLATALLEVSNITYPFRKLLRKYKNIQFRMGEFEEIIPSEKKILLSSGELQYDEAVFATGAATNYFGNENVRANALPMKTVNDAIELRNHFLETVEKASVETNEAERKKLLTVVITGGGPTGVEVSGMLANLRQAIAPKDYSEVSSVEKDSHIYLVTGGDKVLEPMSEKSQQDTYKALTEIGVEVRFGYKVKDYKDDTITFENGEYIEAKTVVWAAGVSPMALKGVPESSYGKGKRLTVDEFNKVKDMNNVYAIGDACLLTTDKNFPNGHPQLAQVALQQGINLAKNFLNSQQNKPLKPFSYYDKGSMAIIGKYRAVADLPKPKIHLKGFIAWAAWLFVHLTFLITHSNRVTTLYNWLVAFVKKDNALRLIIRPKEKA